MNEITQIHLGRTAFVVAVDAQKMLRDYLAAVKKHMGGNDDAVEEVELRMAELLTERGIKADTVVLARDIEYLKEQLGEPKDFDDDEAGDSKAEFPEDTSSRRLFRDTENGMIAGVAAGLANYFRIDAVIVRILFVVATISGGWGILIYLVLWLIVPEAKTPSDTLQMQGKAVTVDAIKEVVERADVRGAATRFQRVITPLVRSIVRLVAVLVGIGLTAIGVMGLLIAITVGVYWALNHNMVVSHLFPVGTGEVVLVILGFVAILAVSVFFLIAGMAAVRRKWPLPGWGLGAIVAVFLASLAVGGALAADAVPQVHARYEAAHRTYTRTVPAFDTVQALANVYTTVRYEESPTYSVSATYLGDVSFASLKTDVKGQTLTIDTRKLTDDLRCAKLCLLQMQTVDVVVRGPKLLAVNADLQGGQFTLPTMHNQTIAAHVQNGSVVAVPSFNADTVKAVFGKNNTWTVSFAGDYAGSSSYGQGIKLYDQSADITARNLDLTFDGTCGMVEAPSTGPWISVGGFENLTVNSQKIGTLADLRAVYDVPGRSAAKCVNIRSYVSDSL